MTIDIHNPDHAPRILALQRIEAETAAMAELERIGAPLLWTMYLAAALFALALSTDAWHRYRELAAQNDVMVQCLNGHPVALGNSAILHCQISEYRLVALGGQP